MNTELKKEALEQVEKDIKIGFETEEELLESIGEMFYDHEDFDEEWLEKTINSRFKKYRKESLNWSRPTDFDRLHKAFTGLIEQKIVCLDNAGYTKQDSIAECEEAIEELDKIGVQAIGYCYYNTQNIESAIDPQEKYLFLGFGSTTEDEKQAVIVGKKIVEILHGNGFKTQWNGADEEKIKIININWQKLPEEDYFGINDMIQMLS
jgi:hypothetical protein